MPGLRQAEKQGPIAAGLSLVLTVPSWAGEHQQCVQGFFWDKMGLQAWVGAWTRAILIGQFTSNNLEA